MNNLTSSLPKWFVNLNNLGKELGKLHDKNFVFCICLPTLDYSCPAILLGLVKEYLNILSTKEKSFFILENLEEGTEIKYHDFGGGYKHGIFVKVEEKQVLNQSEKYAHIKIKGADQFIPIRKAYHRIQPLSEEMIQNDNFEIGKIIKNTFHGFENVILNNKEKNILQNSLTSKVHIIAQKATIEKEINKFKLNTTNQNNGNFNDVIRIRDYVNQGESYFSTLATPLKAADNEELKDVKFKFYWGSNSFLKLDNDEDQNFNSIIVLSPNEPNFENSFYAFQKKFSERSYLEQEDFNSLKKLNLNYPSMIFRNN